MSKTLKCTQLYGDVVYYACMLKGGHTGMHVTRLMAYSDEAFFWGGDQRHHSIYWPPKRSGWQRI